MNRGVGTVSTRIRRILVAIRDLHHPPRLELRKAAEMARAAKAAVELFHVVDVPVRSDRPATGTNSHAQSQLSKADQRLGSFARMPFFSGLKVTHHSNCDYPPHEAIVRRATKTRADLVIVATRTRGVAGRLFLRNTDWELIRQCPCPLLLVKSARSYANSVVLAAVDPFHTHSKPADLDARLLDFGGSVARLFKGSVHVFHAFMPMVSLVPMPSAALAVVPPEAEEAHVELVESELNRLASSAGVPPRARHLRMGVVASELCATAKSTRASMVVMGAVSRSALRRIFIGSTAEAALDKLTCDVLVLKPAGFRSSVAVREFKESRTSAAVAA
jgi:universal stress protein E